MSDQISSVVQVSPTLEDYELLQGEMWKPVMATLRYRILSWVNLAAVTSIVAVAVEILVNRGQVPAWVAVIITLYPAMLVSSAISVAVRPWLMRSYLDPKGRFLAGYEARADAEGLHLKGDWGESRYFGGAILNVKETATHVFVFVDRVSAASSRPS